VLTFGVTSYLQRANLPILRINHDNIPEPEPEPEADAAEPEPQRVRWRWALIGIGVMVVLTPLGLLATGGAFGEDAPADLDLKKYGLRAAPRGLVHYSTTWSRAVLGGYGVHSGDHPNIGYVVSAVVGVSAIVGIVFAGFLVARLVNRRSDDRVSV
jgi:cobalt/nickel transport system permease protein